MITEDEVQHVAELSMISLSRDEVQKHRKTLNRILEAMDQLKEVDISSVDLFVHPAHSTEECVNHSVLREDELKESLSQDLILKNAPDVRHGQFKLDVVVGSDS